MRCTRSNNELPEAGYRYWLNAYAGGYPLTQISTGSTR